MSTFSLKNSSNTVVFFLLIRLRKRIRFAMPGRPLSEIHDDKDNTNDTDSSADETEPWIAR